VLADQDNNGMPRNSVLGTMSRALRLRYRTRAVGIPVPTEKTIMQQSNRSHPMTPDEQPNPERPLQDLPSPRTGIGIGVEGTGRVRSQNVRDEAEGMVSEDSLRRQSLNPPELFDSLQYGFSQGLVLDAGRGRRVLLSGQVGVDANERPAEGGIGPQTDAALANIATLMKAAGGSLADVIMLRLYIAERARDEQQPIAEALRRHFPTNPPPSSWIIVKGLSEPEWLIEIEAEAVIP
jgi:2-iminobutanoate/2-iminopropanoate deaminase